MRNLKKILISTFLMFSLLIGFATPTAKAAESFDVKQVGIETDKIVLNITSDDYDTFLIEAEEYGSNNGYVSFGETKEKSFQLNNLKPGTKYIVRVTARSSVNPNAFEDFKYVYGGTLVHSPIVKQTEWYKYIEKAAFEWDKQSNADGYELELLNPKGKIVATYSESGYTYSKDVPVKNNNIYTVNVRAFCTYEGVKKYSDWSTIKLFSQPNMKETKVYKVKKKVKGKKKKKTVTKLKISWYKQAGATGYDVYVSKKNNLSKYKLVKSLGKKKSSISLEKFNKKKIKGGYYVYVVSKTKLNGKTVKSGITYTYYVKGNVTLSKYVNK